MDILFSDRIIKMTSKYTKLINREVIFSVNNNKILTKLK